MLRPRVFLLEDEAALVSILLRFFELEAIEVTVCSSAVELRQRLAQDPNHIVVADWWTGSVGQELSNEGREDIEALGRVAAGVIVTTACAWAVRLHPTFSSDVLVMPKPYDLDSLVENIRVKWARARRLRSRLAWRHITRVAGAACAKAAATRGVVPLERRTH
jgi:DNA-binding response OmpR family regulator